VNKIVTKPTAVAVARKKTGIAFYTCGKSGANLSALKPISFSGGSHGRR
jgi:hypothetical protein